MSEKCVIPPNDDVLGIGIRINFYTTMVFLSIIPRTPLTEELLSVLYTNTGIAGFGLLVTAIEQTATNQLSFFHAIFIQHMLFFLGISAAPVGKYYWTRSRLAIWSLIQCASFIAFTGWELYLWIHAKDFGPQPQCNDKVKYILMFINVRATVHWLRGIWIAIIAPMALMSVMWFVSIVCSLCSMRADVEEGNTEGSRGWYFYMSLLAPIYSTVMLELTVQRNSTAHGGVVTVDTQWSFGQILSVVMIFSNINEVVHCLFGYTNRRPERSREHQAEAQQASNETDVPPAAQSRPSGLPVSHLSDEIV